MVYFSDIFNIEESILEEFARIMKDKYIVLELNVASSVGGTQYRGQFEEKISQDELEAVKEKIETETISQVHRQKGPMAFELQNERKRCFSSGERIGYSTGRKHVYIPTRIQLLYVTQIRRRVGEGTGERRNRDRTDQTGDNREGHQGATFGKDADIRKRTLRLQKDFRHRPLP